MSLLNFYILPCGRVNRVDYVLKWQVPWLITGALLLLLGGHLAFASYVSLTTWPYVAINTKRFHDFGWPAWGMFCAHIVGPIAVLFISAPLIGLLVGVRNASIASIVYVGLSEESIQFAFGMFAVTVATLLLPPSLIPGNNGFNRYGPVPDGR